jgi:pimeloyl-ACP methyl ester carboxylesterase
MLPPVLLGLFNLLWLGLVIGLALLTWQTLRTLTHPPRRGYTWAVAKGLPGSPAECPPPPDGPGPRPFREFTFTSRGLKLPAWELPGDRPDGPALIFSHGWGESRLHALQRLHAWLPHCARVIAWDMPGHGDAAGSCALGTDEVDDLLELVAAVGPTPGGLVLHGFSLGAGVSLAAAALAAPASLRTVILEAPYRFPQTPARRVMRLNAVPAWPSVPCALGLLGLFRFGQGTGWFSRAGAARFDRRTFATQVSVPVLVLHGLLDRVCPSDDGIAIASAASGGQFVPVPEGGHLDLWTNPACRSLCTTAVQSVLGNLANPPTGATV